MSRWARLLCVALVVAAVGCTPDDNGGSARERGGDTGSTPTARVDPDLLDRTAEVIVEGYEGFQTAARELGSALDSLCSNPGPEPLGGARERWRRAHAAWHYTIAFGVGPAMELRTMSAVDFPTSADKVADIAAGTEPVTPASVGALGANARGLGAVEELLFGAGADDLTGPSGARRCQYALAASGLVVDAAGAVAAGWTSGPTPYREAFVADAQESLDGVYNEVVRTLQRVADLRLARAVGDSTGTPEPDQADPGPARAALDDMVAEVDGVVAMFDALLEPAIARQSRDAAKRARSELDTGRDALKGLPRPLASALVEQPAEVRAALDALKQAKRTLATEVASLLGLTLSFSDGDGDS